MKRFFPCFYKNYSIISKRFQILGEFYCLAFEFSGFHLQAKEIEVIIMNFACFDSFMVHFAENSSDSILYSC